MMRAATPMSWRRSRTSTTSSGSGKSASSTPEAEEGESAASRRRGTTPMCSAPGGVPEERMPSTRATLRGLVSSSFMADEGRSTRSRRGRMASVGGSVGSAVDSSASGMALSAGRANDAEARSARGGGRRSARVRERVEGTRGVRGGARRRNLRAPVAQRGVARPHLQRGASRGPEVTPRSTTRKARLCATDERIRFGASSAPANRLRGRGTSPNRREALRRAPVHTPRVRGRYRTIADAGRWLACDARARRARWRSRR